MAKVDYSLFEMQQEVFDRSFDLDAPPSDVLNELIGEMGELGNVLKKEKYYAFKKSYKEKVDTQVAAGVRQTFEEQRIDEAGDSLFYFIKWLSYLGLNLNDVWEKQLEKLRRQDIEVGELYQK